MLPVAVDEEGRVISQWDIPAVFTGTGAGTAKVLPLHLEPAQASWTFASHIPRLREGTRNGEGAKDRSVSGRALKCGFRVLRAHRGRVSDHSCRDTSVGVSSARRLGASDTVDQHPQWCVVRTPPPVDPRASWIVDLLIDTFES